MEHQDETTMNNLEKKPPLSSTTTNEPDSYHQTMNPSSPSPPPEFLGGDDLPISSMAGHTSTTQNPPVQAMERTEEQETPAPYRIPSRVFRRTNTGALGWSGESLFSIQMGNMSFTKEIEWLNSEMPGDPLPPLTSNINNSNACNASNQINDNKTSSPTTSNEIQSNNEYKATYKGDESIVEKPVDSINTGGYQIQGNKFNDMSQNVGKFHKDSSDEMTEAKAAEMMRQIIMENSNDYELSCASGKSRMDDGFNHNNNGNDVSHHSNNNNDKSYTFNNPRHEGGKSQSSSQERLVQEKKTLMQTKPCSDYLCACFSNLCKSLCCCFTCCIRR